MLPALAIIAQCILLAVGYGIAHDMVTAHLCVEYFTIGHPRIFSTESPTLLAFGWGVIATWWVGVILGVPLALAARVGSWPRLRPRNLWKPLLRLLGVMATCAVLSAMIGLALASKKVVILLEPLASAVPSSKHVAFLADLWAHSASYLVGFVGGIVVIGLTVRRRWKLRPDRSPTAPQIDP